jgi:hypothetical protein
MQLLFDALTRWPRLLFGSKQLLPLEDLCFSAWRQSLPEQARAILERQLAQVAYIERQAGGAKAIFRYPSGKPDMLFPNTEPDQVAASIVLGSCSDVRPEHTFGVKLFVHRGRLFSIEFPKRPDRLLEKHGLTETDLRVLRVEPVAVLT